MGNILDKSDGQPYRKQNIIVKTVSAKKLWSLTYLPNNVPP